MRVSKWGNALAVRLPKALVEEMGLKSGDEVTVANGDGELLLTKAAARQAALRRMAERGWTLPEDYKFDRDEELRPGQ